MKVKTLVRAKVSGEAESHSRTILKARDLIDVSDEPAERGGTNEGFAPTEMFLASLIACSNVITHKIAKQHGIKLDALAVSLDAGFNRLGVTLQEEIELPFPDIQLNISATTDASNSELDQLKRDLPRYCPVSKMIEAAGTDITTVWEIQRP